MKPGDIVKVNKQYPGRWWSHPLEFDVLGLVVSEIKTHYEYGPNGLDYCDVIWNIEEGLFESDVAVECLNLVNSA